MNAKLSKMDIIALVIGSVIGWGAFYLPGQKFLVQSGVINTAIGFLIGWVLIYFIQVAYHVMMDNHKEKGGEFSYIYEHLGKLYGFIVGWSLTFCYLTLIPLNATAVALVIRSLFPGFLYGQLYSVAGYTVYASDLVISTGVILFFYFINKKGLSLSMTLQKLLIMMLVLFVFIITIALYIKADTQQFRTFYLEQYQFSFKEILQVLAIIPFLFVGFDIVPQVLTDIGFPTKFATRMTVLATGFGVLIYNLLNLMTAFAYTPLQVQQLEWASGQAVLDYLGIAGFVGLAVALTAAIVGGVNGFMIGSSRILASLGSYKLLPENFKTENNSGVPEKSLQFVTFISILMPLLGRMVILYIVDLSSLMAALTYVYVSFVSSRLAKTPFERWCSNIALVIGILFILLLIVPGSPSQLSVASFVILGIWTILGFLYFTFINNETISTKEK